MRNWISLFDRKPTPPAGSLPSSEGATRAAASATGASATPPPIDWPARLRDADGNDEALLALARERAPLEVKLAAVTALQTEPALRQAEAMFRDHDRRVHRLAKQRLAQQAAVREARERAGELLVAARATAAREQIALNELVELDRRWRALDAGLIDRETQAEMEALLVRMETATREQADQPMRLRRWTEGAERALATLERAGVDAIAGHGDPQTLSAAGEAVRQAVTAAPLQSGHGPHEALATELARALDRLVALQERLQAAEVAAAEPAPAPAVEPQAPVPVAGPVEAPAEEAPAPAPDTAPPEADVTMTAQVAVAVVAEATAGEVLDASAEAALTAPVETPVEALVEAPVAAVEAAPGEAPEQVAVETAAEAPVEAAAAGVAPPAAAPAPPALPPLGLPAWDEAWQRRVDHARASTGADHEAKLARKREADRAKAERRAEAQREAAKLIEQSLQLAETALDEGHLAPAHNHLLEIDRLLDQGASAGSLRGRIDAVQARYAQLKGWQHWAGSRARDDLLAQAEALAAKVALPRDQGGMKLGTRQLAELISELRARWKELDRVAGASPRSLWKRFDTALETAYQPITAQIQAQREARERNRQEREALLAAFEAVPLTGSPDATPDGGIDAAADAAPATAPDWRALAGTLERFLSAWRKLGPLEHTVPHAARAGLAARLEAAVQRIEAPLQAARRSARSEREALVAEARALAEAGLGRDLVPRVRDLQARWQHHAHALPLARADEGALWNEFRAALDAAFAARHAAFDARDAELRQQAAGRIALIERLEALTEDTPTAQLKRTLDEVDGLWHRSAPAPRAAAAGLDARYGRAREAVRLWIGSSGLRQWHQVCDALRAKLELCEEREAGADPSAAPPAAGDGLAERWAAWPALPQPLEAALAERAGLAAAAAPRQRLQAATDELLLQIEAQWNLASPPAFEAARRELKLQAMKAALESRRPASPPATPALQLTELLRRPGLDPTQRQRLGAVVEALRRRGSIGPV